MNPHPELGPLVTKLFHDFATGVYSQNELRALPQYKPLQLTKSTISRMLKQIAYAGKINIRAFEEEPEENVLALHEPLVSMEIFNQV